MRRHKVDKQGVIDAIKEAAQRLGHSPSRPEFEACTQIPESQVLRHFDSWNDAVSAAGFQPNLSNVRLDPSALLDDWGQLVRKLRRIPTRWQYKKHGRFGASTFENKFGPWSRMPLVFRSFAETRPEWSDVLALLPISASESDHQSAGASTDEEDAGGDESQLRYPTLVRRPTYGNPIDFRGLRHEPVNEQGVVFLFGMVAKELGYMVEAVQTGFPDCEAKRQVNVRQWQKVFVEFEYESRSFREHGHPTSGCDVIVCWIHNWPECPGEIEVLELRTVIRTLARSDD